MGGRPQGGVGESSLSLQKLISSDVSEIFVRTLRVLGPNIRGKKAGGRLRGAKRSSLYG